MAKDPAFLYYDGDAARDMAHMTRLERGCYLDILHAQKKRDLLTLDDIRKVLGQDFEMCWPSVEWVMSREGNYYFIEWLRDSLRKREKFSESRRQNRKKGRGDTSLSSDDHVCKDEKVDNDSHPEVLDIKPLIPPINEDMNDTSYLGDKTSVIHVENENENGHVVENFERGSGKTFAPSGIVPDMAARFRETFPDYAFDQRVDFPACMAIARKIGDWMGILPEDVINSRSRDVLLRWGELIDFCVTNPWFSCRSLTDLATAKEFQRLSQSFKSKQNGFSIESGGGPGKPATIAEWGADLR